MKILAAVAGALLGALFLFASISFFVMDPAKMPLPPEGTPIRTYFDVMASSHYLTVVKIFELIGGLLVLIPATRRAGLLLLGPIIVNIIITHAVLMGDGVVKDPMVDVAIVLALVLVYAERRAFATFLWGGRAPAPT